MEDKNDLSTQRRNLMLMNILHIFLFLTNKEITIFKILNITFKIDENIKLINSFNDLLIIVFIYFLIRYLSTIFNNKIIVNAHSEKRSFPKTNNLLFNFLNKITHFLGIYLFSKYGQLIFPVYFSCITISLIVITYLSIYSTILFTTIFITLIFIYSKVSKEKDSSHLKNEEILKFKKLYKEKKKILKK